MMRSLSVLIGTVAMSISSGAAFAASPLELHSDVFVERQVMRADGSKATLLEKPNRVTPGDSLVFVVKYKNIGTAPASNMVVTNPLPTAVAFNGTADGLELVSVDGGKKWGPLGTLRIGLADGKSRAAQMTDVTHIKWNLNQKLTVGAEGKLIFRGVVR